MNPREGFSSSFDPSGIRKVNTVISLQLGKKVGTHVHEQNKNDPPSPSSSLPSPQSDDVFPSLIIQIPSEDVDEPKEGELIHDFTSPKDSPTPSTCVTRPPSPFPNRLKGKKVQSHVDKIREMFSQIKINIP